MSAVNLEARRAEKFPQAGLIPAEDFKIKRAPTGRGPVGSGMTDPFAVERFKELFIPMGWTVK